MTKSEVYPSNQIQSPDFWTGKRVFLTSANSDLGAWTALSLRCLGAQVFGVAEDPTSKASVFDLLNVGSQINISYGSLIEEGFVEATLNNSEADVVLHLGEVGDLNPREEVLRDSLKRSILGTANLLECLRQTATVRSVLVLGSDKVYERGKNQDPNREDSLIVPQEFLPTFKLCSEMIALSYRRNVFNPSKYNKHKIALATARIESGFGGGDLQKETLFAQAAEAFSLGQKFELHHPHSFRPWIHVLDQVSGLLCLAQGLWVRGPKLAGTYHLGAQDYRSVGEVMREFAQLWGGGAEFFLQESASEGSPSYHGRLNSELAKNELGWSPRWALTKALKQTALWYKNHHSGQSLEFLNQDIVEFWNR